MRNLVKIQLDLTGLFPTCKENAINRSYFTVEAVANALKDIKDKPFIIEKDDCVMPIGVIQSYEDGFLWLDLYPEVIVDKCHKDGDNMVITSFELGGINIKI